jgi:hypothetical protein
MRPDFVSTVKLVHGDVPKRLPANDAGRTGESGTEELVVGAAVGSGDVVNDVDS